MCPFASIPMIACVRLGSCRIVCDSLVQKVCFSLRSRWSPGEYAPISVMSCVLDLIRMANALCGLRGILLTLAFCRMRFLMRIVIPVKYRCPLLPAGI